MLGLSWGELLLIGAVALLVMKPEDMPGVVRQVLQWVRSAKRYASDVGRELETMVKDTGVEEVKEVAEAEMRYIKDAEGNFHPAYDLKDIEPYLKKSEPKGE